MLVERLEHPLARIPIIQFAVFAVADAVREESREAVQRLHTQGIEVIMMTGDAQAVARAVATDLGIDTVFAEVLREQKAANVKQVQPRGKRRRHWSTTA